MSHLNVPNTQFRTITYRNAIYEGGFNKHFECRQGFGLVYSTDNHMVMGTNWQHDEVNQATFIYYNHAHYVYGFWKENVPHGFNAIRMDKIVFFTFCDLGIIQGRILVIYEQYNLAVVLEKNQQNQFEEIEKGDILSDQDFNAFIGKCNWLEFRDEWKTLIKFMSEHMTNQSQQNYHKIKLRMVNQTFYRYGYDDGIAIIFDDQYKIISAGVHKKAKLKSLGVRFPKQTFIEQGNFSIENEIFAFNQTHRPEVKLHKLYSNFLLSNVNFINKFVCNPAKNLIYYLEDQIKSSLFRKLIAGQITSRKLDVGSPGSLDNSQSRRRGSHESGMQENKEENEILREIANKKLKQEKARLDEYRREILGSLSKRSRAVLSEQQIKQLTPDKAETKSQNQRSLRVIHKEPVEITTRSNRKRDLIKTKSRSRSPIFAPDKFESRSPSPSKVSPFKEKIRSKIFKDSNKKYSYEPIGQQLYPKHASKKKYSSPHEELQFSRSNAMISEATQQIPVVPISFRRQKDEFQNKNRYKQVIKEKPDHLSRKKPNTREYDQQKALKISNKQENPYLITEQVPQRDIFNTNMKNIVIKSPHKSKSPAPKRIIGINQEGNQRKNNVYLKTKPITTKEEIQPENVRKEIKGITYLDRYKQQNRYHTPQKQSRSPKKQERKYNKTIKNFNQNSRVYEKVQSSPEDEDSKRRKKQQDFYLSRHTNTATPVREKKYKYMYE